MTVTLHDIKPMGLVVVTQELFDTKRFMGNYCDGLILRGGDQRLKNKLQVKKREISSIRTQEKYLEGYKAVITSNLDKIMALVQARYAKTYSPDVEVVLKKGGGLIERVMSAENMDKIAELEPEFKTGVMLPTYRLFIDDLKRVGISVV